MYIVETRFLLPDSETNERGPWEKSSFGSFDNKQEAMQKAEYAFLNQEVYKLLKTSKRPYRVVERTENLIIIFEGE